MRVRDPPHVHPLPHTRARRLGYHAADRSYGQLHVLSGSCNVSITFGGGDSLLLRLAPSGASSGCGNFAAVASGSSVWDLGERDA